MILRKLFVFPILLYKKIISPFLPPACRFEPSCSSYAIISIESHGVIRGIALTAARILACAPWGGYGYNPVPGEFTLRGALTPFRKNG